MLFVSFFFFKQKTAYEMRISDWSSDVCSSDLIMGGAPWQPPIWWLPSSRAFVQATLGGLGWTMNPLPLVQQELDEGRLVPLRTRATEDVPLYWQHWRVHSQAMDVLTHSILEAAGGLVKKGGKHA